MILLLDIGNSRIKWATLVHGQMHFGGSVAHRDRLLEEVARSAWQDLPRPSRIWAASVAGPALAEALSVWARDFWGIDIAFVIPQRSAFGIRTAYAEPRQLGADRWATLVAAHHRDAGPAIIVDCGTAITLDVLAADGRHLGGLIVPGLAMMRRSLVQDTQGIAPALALSRGGQTELLACDTQTGILAGTLYAVVALIDRVTADSAEALQTALSCLMTGGDAPAILPLLHGQCQHEQHLVLEGLAIMAQE